MAAAVPARERDVPGVSMSVYMTKSEVSSSAAVLMGQGLSALQTNKQTKGYLLRQLGARHAEEGHRRVPGGARPTPSTGFWANGEQVGGCLDNQKRGWHWSRCWKSVSTTQKSTPFSAHLKRRSPSPCGEEQTGPVFNLLFPSEDKGKMIPLCVAVIRVAGLSFCRRPF